MTPEVYTRAEVNPHHVFVEVRTRFRRVRYLLL